MCMYVYIWHGHMQAWVIFPPCGFQEPTSGCQAQQQMHSPWAIFLAPGNSFSMISHLFLLV